MDLIITALELGLTSSITVLALFISYSMLNVCDLSTDGCFTLGAVVGAMIALSGHPYLSIPASMLAGSISGFITGLLQTKCGINSLLSGIVVNTGLYSINIAILGNKSLINLNNVNTVFSKMKTLLNGTVLESQYKLILVIAILSLLVFLISNLLKTRLGLAIRATGNNLDMVKSSSINPVFTTISGLCISNSLTALSGCLLAQMNKSANVNMGAGMVTVALASLLIGNVIFNKSRKTTLRIIGAVLGSFIFRLVYTIALRFKVPAFMLNLISSIIVILSLSIPFFINKRKNSNLKKKRKEQC